MESQASSNNLLYAAFVGKKLSWPTVCAAMHLAYASSMRTPEETALAVLATGARTAAIIMYNDHAPT